MISGDLVWETLLTKNAARELQTFTCTTERPRTSGRRDLPHPKPWEWEAQAHLRDLSRRMRAGEVLVVARDHVTIVAAAHLIPEVADDHIRVLIAAGAVDVRARGLGGGVADALMAECRDCAERMAAGAEVVLLVGRVHVANLLSQKMAKRAGLEPVGTPRSDYQDWALVLPRRPDIGYA